MSTEYQLKDLAERVGGTVSGDGDRRITGVATLEDAGPGDLSFVTNPRYRATASASRAGALLVGSRDIVDGHDLLVAPQPYAALAGLLELFHPRQRPAPGLSPDARLGRRVDLGRDVHIGPFAVVGDDVTLGDGVIIGAGCFVGDRCRIGPDTELAPRVVLYAASEVGARCIVHSGVVLGGDGFGFATADGRHLKIPQVGCVVIEDDVEIGANTTVDRATLGATRVGAGSKIDNLVMLAHGVRLGPASLLAGQAGVAGSARLGARTTLAGQAGVAGHLELGDGTIVAAKSAVFENLPDGAFVAGIPAVEQQRWKRTVALTKKLPELRREIRSLTRRLDKLERRMTGED